jgi:hypothetical protein
MMPFSEVTDPNDSMGGLTGLVQDGGGVWWRFTEKQIPGSSAAAYVMGPAQSNSGHILQLGGVINLFASADCTGQAYTEWSLAQGYTGASNNPQDQYFYVSTVPGIPYFIIGSANGSGNGNVCTKYTTTITTSVVPQGALQGTNNPSPMPGIPPYHLQLF